MKKKIDGKTIPISFLHLLGLFLLAFIGHTVKGFTLSAIILVLAYILSRFWYGKAADIYGVIIAILLVVVYVFSFAV